MENIDHEKLARLRTLAALHKADIESDPIAYIDKLGKKHIELLRAFDEVEMALHPETIFQLAQDNNIEKPQSIQAEALFRCNAALKVIHDFKSSQS